ncbi:MAG: nuclear transport factor 2 family protein [Planctomycetes bacterium]|nr:nuclear transport factor 2 family protein [Planctomycetota bacterium]
MKTSLLAAAPLLLLLVGVPVLAQDRFELSGESRGQPIEATLLLQGESVTISVVVGHSSLQLAGELKPRGSSLVGTLRSNRGISGALSPGFRTDRWNAQLRREGPLVTLRLASRYRSIKLEGLAVLGNRNLANEALIRRFYSAFVASDGDTMASCYTPDVHFTDPVFPNLRGESAGDMWKMLCASKPKVVFSGIRADGRYGVAHWEADYELFGNKIHNVIEARFEFRDGLIVRHVDQFSFPAWSRQAFGRFVSVLPSMAVRHVVRRISASQLKTFQEEQAGKE